MAYLVDDPTKRAGSVRTGEDVLVHEQTPMKALDSGRKQVWV